MTEFWVELSGENRPLAESEAVAAAEAVGGGPVAGAAGRVPFPVDLPSRRAAEGLAARLALGRRVLEPMPEVGVERLSERLAREGIGGAGASFRPLPRVVLPGALLRSLAGAYVRGGGRIDLSRPARRFFLSNGEHDGARLAESVAEVPRSGFAARRMPRLPFQRPVSLPPLLGRVAVNLAQVKSGDRVADPFLGTGALLIEAGLLGARLHGVDRDATMVRGALENLGALGLTAEQVEVDDAESAGRRRAPGSLDAIVSDPPYGRASPTGGEAPTQLIGRVMAAWGVLVRRGGRVVLVTPGTTPTWDDEWRPVLEVDDRVHRSLTRRFVVYERRA